jgi:hypothetical protein
MSTTLEEVLREARKLPPDEQRELAETLLEEGTQSTAGAAGSHDEKGNRPTGELRRRRLEWMKAHRRVRRPARRTRRGGAHRRRADLPRGQREGARGGQARGFRYLPAEA